VQPQHERRKFLATGERGCTWVKFAGYGRYGRQVAARARALADAGWSPALHGHAAGWLRMPVEEGRPMHAGLADADTIAHLARYAAWVGRTFRTGSAADVEPLAARARHNLHAAIGGDAAATIDRLAAGLPDAPAVALDARMAPHEWLLTPHGPVKTDSAEHADDHFYPGPADVAWDLAAAAEEWRLDASAARCLIARYVRESGDATVARRLPFYRLAYLAFRLGYVTLALSQLGDSDDGRRFRAAEGYYRSRVRRHLAGAGGRRSAGPRHVDGPRAAP
jgi:hypothetical protein